MAIAPESAADPGCEEGLRELERRGHPVWRVRGYSAIDAARNHTATGAIAKGFPEFMWIDGDYLFHLPKPGEETKGPQ